MGNDTIPCPQLTTDDVDPGDTAWMIAASGFVLVMTPGLGFFYGGYDYVLSLHLSLQIDLLCTTSVIPPHTPELIQCSIVT